ncbi:MAG: bifunctional glutamate N-acetyltransferase/amino-acid acetyltransferase ArgJ [Methanosarcinales archaeon]|nr:bifunctional glutamate N-acetyltransferase/amino-acid acetyltransferase ArgJ [Methanosarcinales archaeon]
MNRITGGVCAVRGVRAFGIRELAEREDGKESKNGLAVITGSGESAGVFTKNRIIAPPLTLTRAHLEARHRLGAVIVNSGCANAFTGKRGLSDAGRMAELAAERLNLEKDAVGVASTGVVGVSLDLKWIESQIDSVVAGLSATPEGSSAAAQAIMTTDTRPKEFAVELGSGVRIGGIAKGSGMIAPDMATMLAFIYTDADLPHETLETCLKQAVDTSFNMIVVDGDTSTNDMVLLTATAEVGAPEYDEEEFQEGLDCVCTELAKMIARDGEGAEKLIEVRVTGAETNEDAEVAAKAIVRSPLVKTAVHGCDPNWGRVVVAIGYSGAAVDPDLISLALSGVRVVDCGTVLDFAGEDVDMSGEDVGIDVDLGLGAGEATAWGCDLTCEYVRINAEYTS